MSLPKTNISPRKTFTATPPFQARWNDWWIKELRMRASDLYEICGGHSQYSRALDDKFAGKPAMQHLRAKLREHLNQTLISKGFYPLTETDFSGGPPARRRSVENAKVYGEEVSEQEAAMDGENDHLYGYVKQLSKRLSGAEKHRNKVSERQLVDNIATTYESLQIWREAIVYLRRLEEINAHFEDHVSRARALVRLGLALYRMEQFSEAIVTLRRAIKLLRREKDVPKGAALKTEAKAHDYVALAALRLGKPRTALILLEKRCAPLRQRLKTPLATAALDVRLGLVHSELGNFDMALKHILNGLKLLLKYEAQSHAAHALHNLGLLHHRRGQLPQALLVLQFCLKWQEALEDLAGQAKTHFCRARIFHQLHDAGSRLVSSGLQSPLVTVFSSTLFPNPLEMECLEQVARIFPYDREKTYQPAIYAPAARYHLECCLDLARSHGGNTLIREAKAELNQLPPRPSHVEAAKIRKPVGL